MNKKTFNAHFVPGEGWAVRWGESVLLYVVPRPDIPGYAAEETAVHVAKAMTCFRALGPSDDLLRAVSKQAIENDDLKDRLAAADARVAHLSDLVAQLDETLEEALHQLRIEYR